MCRADPIALHHHFTTAGRQLIAIAAIALLSSGGASSPTVPWRSQFPGEQFVKVDGVDIRYEKTGRGPPVVLVHGISDSMEAFGFLAPRLEARYTVYRLDVKGAGHSARPWPSDYSVRGMGTFLTRFLDAVGVQRAAFVGSSWGGIFVLRVAILHPDRVAALVPIGTMAYREPVTFSGSWWLARWPVLRWLAPTLVTRGRVQPLFEQYMFSPGYAYARPRFDEYYRNLERDNGKRVFVAFFNGWTGAEFEDTERRYRQLFVPTLILWGEKDAFFPPEQAERLHRDIRGSRLRIVPNGSHSIVEENADSVAGELLRFLDELPPWK